MRLHALIGTVAASLILTLLAPPGARAQDIPEMSAEAAEAFAEGMAMYTAAEYAEAAEAFARARELDPSFAVAAFFEGVNWGNAGEAERARDALEKAAEGRERMSPYYRHRLDGQLASLEGDRAAYVEENRKAAALAPGSKAVYNVAQGAVQLRRPREALEALATLDPDRPPMKGWPGYWGVLHGAQHQVAEHAAELETAREARRRYPDAGAYWYDEAQALAGLGRAEELLDLAEAFVERGSGQAVFLVTIAAEADAHGLPDASRELLDRAMARFAEMTPEQRATNGVRNWKALAHYSRGELAEAGALFRELVAENPDSDSWRSWVALVAGEQGDREAAEAEIRRLSQVAADGGPANRLLWAASIAAAMGDGDRFGELVGQALEAGLLYSAWHHRHPAYRKIRGHPAYEAFRRPVG